MKYLNQFVRFDIDAFLHGKVCRVVGVSDYIDYNSKKRLGNKVEVVITKDDTIYKLKEGEIGSNRFEKLVFKVAKDVSVQLDDVVEPVNAVATVYGEFKNQLSIKADDIIVLQAAKKA